MDGLLAGEATLVTGAAGDIRLFAVAGALVREKVAAWICSIGSRRGCDARQSAQSSLE